MNFSDAKIKFQKVRAAFIECGTVLITDLILDQ